jgi:hypothetical protein
LETELGEKIITQDNKIDYEYKKEKLIESWKTLFLLFKNLKKNSII